MDPVADALRGLRHEFETLELAKREFPMMCEWGVEDFSHTIHSLGCNYLATLGRELGFWGISEYPVRIPTTNRSHSVRSDVAWWSRPEGEVVLLGEFERFDTSKDKLGEKARNLLQAHHTLGDGPRVLLLVAWALSGTDTGSPASVRSVMNSGFRPRNAPAVPGLSAASHFLMATAVFGDVQGKRRLLRVRT